ncbi:MAG: transketolase [Eggerthellaceae bacterium]|nr:transketolase [Eggerthellaceae bacterium]
MDAAKKKELKILACKIRIGATEAIMARGFGHIGGSLSVCDILAVLYGELMNVDPSNPEKPDRDKLVCSKGHAGPAIYAALALRGFYPYDDIKTLNQPGTNFPSHCDKQKTPGVDMTTGSLGQGCSAAVGIALADKINGRKSKTYLIVGDGESDEGQVWEAAMFTAGKKITNLIWIIDNNKKQLDGNVEEVLDSGDLRKKFEAFGFKAIRVKGDNVEAIYEALTSEDPERPIAVILDSIKGAGISGVENAMANHSMHVDDETFHFWVDELYEKLADLEK